MNFSRTLVIAIIVAALSILGQGQELPKAVLFDEFSILPCGDLLARTDSFAAELASKAGTTGVIIISPPAARPESAATVRKLISSNLQLRGLGEDRFLIYFGGPSADGTLYTQFWKLPSGAEPPSAAVTPWPEPAPPDTSRAFIFGYEDEYGICPTFVPKNFAKLILENPGSRGHIVVRVGDDGIISKFHFAEGWIKDLVEKHGVPRKRLRLFLQNEKELRTQNFGSCRRATESNLRPLFNQ